MTFKTLKAYESYLNDLASALAGSQTPHPQTAPSHTVLPALTLKVLRLADSLRGLLLARHGRETGPNLRSLLQAYVNLKFIINSGNVEGAAIRFQMHLDHVRQNMKPHLVREDKPTDGFPVMTEGQWAEDETINAQRRADLVTWMAENNVTEMAPFRVGTDKKGKPLKPVGTWSGMNDYELFDYVGEGDAWRYYVRFSDEIHANIGGIGGLSNEVNQGVANLSDDEGEEALWLGAKYAYRSLLSLDSHFKLGIESAADAAFQRFEKVLLEELSAVPPVLGMSGRDDQ